jgi:hypothetical protein
MDADLFPLGLYIYIIFLVLDIQMKGSIQIQLAIPVVCTEDLQCSFAWNCQGINISTLINVHLVHQIEIFIRGLYLVAH